MASKRPIPRRQKIWPNAGDYASCGPTSSNCTMIALSMHPPPHRVFGMIVWQSRSNCQESRAMPALSGSLRCRGRGCFMEIGTEPRPEGARPDSPGQRPGDPMVQSLMQAPTGRNVVAPRPGSDALSGLRGPCGLRVPGLRPGLSGGAPSGRAASPETPGAWLDRRRHPPRPSPRLRDVPRGEDGNLLIENAPYRPKYNRLEHDHRTSLA